MEKTKNHQQGFTLIEILVVIAIIGIITGLTSDIFVQIIKGSNKANILTEVKQNGDTTLNQIDRLIRNAEEISAMGGRAYKPSAATKWTESEWTDSDEIAPPSTQTCNSDVCALIVKNPLPTSGYTKIELHAESDQECSTSPFTTADQTTNSSGNTVCSGNIRLLTKTTVQELKDATEIGQVITNTEKSGGVSVSKNPTVPFFTLRTVSSKPSVITIAFDMAQGIAASSRADSTARAPFSVTLSLRSY